MVVFDPSLFSKVEALRQIQSATLKTVQFLKALNYPSSTPDSLPALEPSQATFAPLNLPHPEEILAPILKLTASENLRDAIRNCFTNHIAEMQRKYTANYQQTCAFILRTAQPDAPNCSLRGLQQAYLDLYRSQCHAFVETQLPYVMKEIAKLERSMRRRDTTRIEFNHEYTPILESYFAYNAYPLLPDRLLLARKSMMTPRQIEVWFQNHRNRAKKDGVTLRRISPSTASTFSFDRLVPHSPLVVTPNRSRSATVDIESSDDDVSLQSHEDIVFNDHRPPHAFPTPYSAKFGNEPFSQDNQIFKLASHDWMRLPPTHAPRRSSMSVNDLTSLFAEMNMRAHARPSRSSKSVTKQRKWVSSLVVTPAAAPHPAAVHPSYVSLLTTVQTSDSCSWQQPSLRTRKPRTSRTQVSYPSWLIPNTPRRQKSPYLVRRLPSSPLNAHCFNTSPRNSSASSSSSSSSSSISSTTSRSSSMSSLSSQATVELPDTTSGSLMTCIGNEADCRLADAQWEFDSSSALQSFSSSISQNGFYDLSRDWTMPNFVTMDLPAFAFFES
ncbi:hypothetical protein D9619_002863 [Psilocybe cf. subviscida]|uniref:Homeobox domain-containing protein n=1 Tax=Psilocybe cf. subviscida TaxID=2480587 RepID=A0A8H5AVR3_9AGAR|nr:hypothetical protein D9619_002863 [Psilocybe cf. subviscida]